MHDYCPRNHHFKYPINMIIVLYKKAIFKKVKKLTCFKWTYGLSGNDYRVDKLP